MDAVMAASPEELAAVEGVGPVVARSLHAWFQDERHREIVERIRAGGRASPTRARTRGHDRSRA
jgi:DNA ligase (NAD+)